MRFWFVGVTFIGPAASRADWPLSRVLSRSHDEQPSHPALRLCAFPRLVWLFSLTIRRERKKTPYNSQNISADHLTCQILALVRFVKFSENIVPCHRLGRLEAHDN